MPNYLRIGSVSSLTGVAPDTLRAWERRYGLFSPARTSGRFRLYSDDDVTRVQEMERLIAAGIPASEAARRVLTQGGAGEGQSAPPLVTAGQSLYGALRSLDEGAIEGAIDRVLAAADLDTAIRDIFVPALIDIGRDWEEGRLSVAQEHFSVGVLRARLMGLARGWDMGLGPRALLACPPGEEHDVSLVMFGLALHRRGWRVTFLGANTPLDDLLDTRSRLAPRLTVLYSPAWGEHRSLVPALSAAAASAPLTLAGATSRGIAEEVGCRWLDGDPVTAAEEVTREAALIPGSGRTGSAGRGKGKPRP